MKALVGAFNQEKALVGAFSVIVQPVVEQMDRFTALVRNISNLNFEFYLSFMITTGLELPADLASIPGINWLGRR